MGVTVIIAADWRSETGAQKLVVGHHLHVPQGWETHHGSAIFYSLGNFRFEQPDRPKVDWGLALDFSLDGGSTSDIDLVPTELDDGTVDEIPHERAVDEHLQYLYCVTECIGSREALLAHWQETAPSLGGSSWRRPR